MKVMARRLLPYLMAVARLVEPLSLTWSKASSYYGIELPQYVWPYPLSMSESPGPLTSRCWFYSQRPGWNSVLTLQGWFRGLEIPNRRPSERDMDKSRRLGVKSPVRAIPVKVLGAWLLLHQRSVELDTFKGKFSKCIHLFAQNYQGDGYTAPGIPGPFLTSPQTRLSMLIFHEFLSTPQWQWWEQVLLSRAWTETKGVSVSYRHCPLPPKTLTLDNASCYLQFSPLQFNTFSLHTFSIPHKVGTPLLDTV